MRYYKLLHLPSFKLFISIAVQGGDFVLTISLKNYAHTLLPSIPPLLSHDVTFRFNSVCDPTHPTKLALGARKQTTKQSSAINAVHIKSNSRQTHPIEISPIEAPPDTPVQVSTLQRVYKKVPTMSLFIVTAYHRTSLNCEYLLIVDLCISTCITLFRLVYWDLYRIKFASVLMDFQSHKFNFPVYASPTVVDVSYSV